MRPVSPEFLEAVTKPHVAVTKAVLTDATQANTALEPTDGSVTLDASAAIRGTCELTVVDDGTKGLVPMVATDALTPFGSKVTLKRGVRLLDGTEEYASLGVFIISDVDIQDTGDNLEIRISGQDKASKVSDAKFEKPYQVLEGTLFTDAIRSVVADVIDVGTPNFIVSARETPFLMARQEGDDRWDFAQGLALGVASDLWWDGDGNLTLQRGNPTQIQLSLTEGEDGVLVEAGRNWTRDGIVNRWIITGENSGEQTFRAVATDDDPASPTRYGGPFGRVPRFESLDTVKSTEQASEVAELLRTKQLGLAQAVSFGAVVNPALEPGDVVKITRERTGINEAHVIDTLTIPLSHDASMTGQTRAKKV